MRKADYFQISGVDVNASTLANNATTNTDAFSLKVGNEVNHYVNIHLIGASFGSSSLSVRPQQSDDGTDWVNVPNVSAFALNSGVTSGSIQFTTAAPYIRLAIAKTGTDALTLIAKGLATKDILEITQAITLDGSGINATAAEINKKCDDSAMIQTLTASGAITAGKQAVYLSHATVVIASTIADASAHQGLFLLKDSSASGTAAHTCTITTGTWNGTNKVATLNAPDESLLVYFDGSGNGTIVVNNGSVALSG